MKTSGVYVDGTVGEGGHSYEILSSTVPSPRMLCLDLDEESLDVAKVRLRSMEDKVIIMKANYSDMGTISKSEGFMVVNGILLDLGLSSRQIENRRRGFSFMLEGALDMRFDKTDETLTARDVVNEYPEEALADVIRKYGEERKARRIAKAIRGNRPLNTTIELANVVARAAGGRNTGAKVHPATRTFQAIRIEVNDELQNVSKGIDEAVNIATSGGRIAIISYHSIEDRIVKNAFRQRSADCICDPHAPVCVCNHAKDVKLVNKKVIKPSYLEIRNNHRSRSAKLRIAEKL